MAKKLLAPLAGAVALPTGFAGDFVSFDLEEFQATESVAHYGGDTYDGWRGNGTPHQSGSVSAIGTYNAAGTAAGFGAMADDGGNEGGAATLTLDAGVTMAGDYLVSRIRAAHRRLGVFVGLTFQLETAGDPVITWPVGS